MRNITIGHFRVRLSLHFKASLSAKSLLWKSVFIHIVIGTNYHNKSFALRLALRERLRRTRKWPIQGGQRVDLMDNLTPRVQGQPNYWHRKKLDRASIVRRIFKTQKFTAVILVRPLCWETSVCIDKTSMAPIAARIFYYRFICYRFIIFRPQFQSCGALSGLTNMAASKNNLASNFGACKQQVAQSSLFFRSVDRKDWFSW